MFACVRDTLLTNTRLIVVLESTKKHVLSLQKRIYLLALLLSLLFSRTHLFLLKLHCISFKRASLSVSNHDQGHSLTQWNTHTHTNKQKVLGIWHNNYLSSITKKWYYSYHSTIQTKTLRWPWTIWVLLRSATNSALPFYRNQDWSGVCEEYVYIVAM